MKVTRSLEETVWRDFVDRHPAGNVFHTPEMFQVFARAKGHRPTLWATVEDGQVLTLLLPVQITLRGRLLHRLTTRSVVYGSVLSVPGPKGQEALALLLRTYVEKVDGAPLFTELRNLSDLGDAQPLLQERGFVYEDHLNYLLDLNRPPEEILQSIGSRTRKHIRRGLRRGEVIVKEMQERTQVSDCYDLLRQTYRTARVPLADHSLFKAAFDILYARGMIRFTLAYVKDTPVAISVELLYKDAIYGWYGGVDRAYGSYMPNELLTWRILKWGVEHSYRVYDFGGAGRPDEEYGVRDFKAKFGGKLVCYGRNICEHAPFLLRISRMGYQLVRRFLSG